MFCKTQMPDRMTLGLIPEDSTMFPRQRRRHDEGVVPGKDWVRWAGLGFGARKGVADCIDWTGGGTIPQKARAFPKGCDAGNAMRHAGWPKRKVTGSGAVAAGFHALLLSSCSSISRLTHRPYSVLLLYNPLPPIVASFLSQLCFAPASVSQHHLHLRR